LTTTAKTTAIASNDSSKNRAGRSIFRLYLTAAAWQDHPADDLGRHGYAKVSDGDSGRTANLLRRYTEIRKEALDFGIPIFDSRKFAKEMGYRLDIKTIHP